MNAAERIVEAYYQLCHGCFTIADRKIVGGNNRQLDILAHSIKRAESLHIEVSVSHRQNWSRTIDEGKPEFDKKFFGSSPERKGASAGNTDHERGKNYFDQICEAYRDVGFDPESVERVWVCWSVKDCEDADRIVQRHRSERVGREFDIEILSMSRHVLPRLLESLGTSNHDDDVLRSLALVAQAEKTRRVK